MLHRSKALVYMLALLAALFSPYALAKDQAASERVESGSDIAIAEQWTNVPTQVVSSGGVDFVPKALAFLAQ